MKRGCDDWELDMIAFLDGELSGDRVEKLAAHVATCSRCSALLADLERADLDVASLAAPPGYWESFNERLLARIATSSRQTHGLWPWLRPLAAVAAAVMLVVGGYWIGRMTGGGAMPLHATDGQNGVVVVGAPSPEAAGDTTRVLAAVEAVLLEVVNTSDDAPIERWDVLAVAVSEAGLLDRLAEVQTQPGVDAGVRLRSAQLEQVLWRVVNVSEALAAGRTDSRDEAADIQRLIVDNGLVSTEPFPERAL
jgi:anti-sigma factor RsiW